MGEAIFLKTRRFEASFRREMGSDTGFEASFWREMGNDTEFEASFWRDKGNNMIKDTSFFTEKREKQGKNRKLQEIQKRDFDEVPGNAENGNEFGNEFGNKFGNKFKNEFEVFSNVTKRRFEGKHGTSSHP